MAERCSTRCDHGSQCTLPAGHGDRHETDHGCICYDPRQATRAAYPARVTLIEGGVFAGGTVCESAAVELLELVAEVERLRELRQHGCDCSDDDACQFARERDTARAEVAEATERFDCQATQLLAVEARIAALEAALRPYAACSCTSDLHTGFECSFFSESILPKEQWCDVCVARAALKGGMR